MRDRVDVQEVLRQDSRLTDLANHRQYLQLMRAYVERCTDGPPPPLPPPAPRWRRRSPSRGERQG